MTVLDAELEWIFGAFGYFFNCGGDVFDSRVTRLRAKIPEVVLIYRSVDRGGRKWIILIIEYFDLISIA